MHSGPVTNAGTEIASSAQTIAPASYHVLWRTAAKVPSHTPTVLAIRNARLPRNSETGSVWARISLTERFRYLVEMRRSPWIRSHR